MTVREPIVQLLSMPMHADIWIDGEITLAGKVTHAGESVVIDS